MADRTPSTSAYLHVLPQTPLTSFVGRGREIANVTSLLSRPDVRLLSLIGPGGIGKTRLAEQVCNQLGEDFAGGIATVQLTSIHDPDLVLPTIAQILNVPDVGDQSLLDRVSANLMARDLLLVLDNVEHLLDSVASLMILLLTRCPGLTVLATSRVRLGISGERVVMVAPLDQETARKLFALRAEESDPTFTLSAQNATVIDAICERLDHLPLAIELAAARVMVLPPSTMLLRLEHPLDFLTTGPRDAPDRHRTMRDTIAWSYALLTPAEQELFRWFGVFGGGLALGAVETLVGNDGLDGITGLVGASLVIRVETGATEPRFMMLVTIRDFAMEQLSASGEEMAVRGAHARYLVSLAEHAWAAEQGPEFEGWIHRLQPEVDNLRLALDWTLHHEPETALQLAGALMEVWISFVKLSEGRGWVARALAAAPKAPTRYRTRALMALGWLALNQGDFHAAETCLTEALGDARTLEDEPMLILCITFLAHVALEQGNVERARELFIEALQRIDQSDVHAPIMPIAVATMNLGYVTMAAGDIETARVLLERALALHTQGSGPIGIAFGHLFLGRIFLEQGSDVEATVHLLSAFTTFADAGHTFTAARTMQGLAAATVGHQPGQAIRLLAAASVIEERGDRAPQWLWTSIHDHTCEVGRAKLGEVAFGAAWDDGTQWTWDEVCRQVGELDRALVTYGGVGPARYSTHGLSAREMEVFQLVAEGASNRAIAERLSVSERTVETHVRHILEKIHVESRTAAVAWAFRHGVVE